MKKQLRSDFNSRQYMLSEDFELYYYSDLHFQSVGRHSHPFYEIYFFAEGQVEMALEEQKLSLRPGEVLVLPPGCSHRALVQEAAVPYRRFVLWLSPVFCETLGRESADYLLLLSQGASRLSLSPIEWNGVQGQLLGLLEELHTRRFGRETRIALLLRQLMLQLSNLQALRSRETRGPKTSAYQSIVDYIAAHLEEDLRLEALSRTFFLNKYYIAHLIQENTGLSLHRYITKKRLAACRDAMRAGESIASCCARYGFQNYSGFYRAFRKEYGLSPSADLRQAGLQGPGNQEE